jgi:hypothetical protein
MKKKSRDLRLARWASLCVGVGLLALGSAAQADRPVGKAGSTGATPRARSASTAT